MRLQGKVALITRGSHGMGAAEARMFAREGARLVIGDVRDGDGKAVVDAITAAGGQARFAHLDVTREPEVLASDEASYITGAELVVDGGYLAT